jgi:hypothetical protein
MTQDELIKNFTNQILEAHDPVEEAKSVLKELDEMVDDDNHTLTKSDKEKIIYEVKYMVDDEMNRSDDTKELNDDAIMEALDILDQDE